MFLNTALHTPGLTFNFCISILIWTCFSVFFLGTFSENYVISCRVSRFFICYCDCRTFCLNTENLWCIWCYCCYREWVAVRPFAKYFLTILIACPCMAVCIVSSLCNIFEVSCCLNLILNNINTCIFIRRIFGCGDYIIISRCTFCFIRRITVALFPVTLTLLIIGVPGF